MVQVRESADMAEEVGSRASSNGGEDASEVSEPVEEQQSQGASGRSGEMQSEQNGTGKAKKKKEKDKEKDKEKEKEKDRKLDKEKDKKLTKAGLSGKGKAIVPAKAAKPKVAGPSEDDTVRTECEKAVKTMKNNPQRAQKAIKETCQKHPTISLGFRYHAYIEKRLAEQQNDASKLKKQHIKTALEAAKLATTLSPNSVEHAFFYAMLLQEYVDGEENAQAIAECERALGIAEPRDPARDMLGELPEELKTTEMRIGHFKHQLRQLSHQMKLSGLQHVFKHVSVDSEGNFVPLMRQLQSNDKDLEQRILQPKRANEVKKSTKTEAERRKQIEAQLEATRLLMHQKEAQEKRKGAKEAAEAGEVEEREQQRGGKGGEKKRGAKSKGQKNGADEKMKKVQPFWETAVSEQREQLLQVPVSELAQRLKSSRSAESSSVLEEALEFYKENQVWKYWLCHKCSAKFKTGIEHKVHVQEKHLIFPAGGDISPVDLPPNFDIDKMLPTDGKEAARLLLEDALQKRIIGPDAKPAVSPNSPTSEAPFLDAHESVPNAADADGSEGGQSAESQFEEAGEQFEPLLKEGEEGEHFVDSENPPPEIGEHFCPTHGANGCPISLGNQDVELPVVEDEKRAKSLGELLGLVRVLIEHKLFFMNHQHKIFQFLVDVLQSLLPDPSASVEWQHDWNLLRMVDEESIAQVRQYLEDEILGEGSDNKLTVTYNVEEDEPVPLDIALSESEEVLAPSKRLMYLLLYKKGDPFLPEGVPVAEAGGEAEGPKETPAAEETEGPGTALAEEILRESSAEAGEVDEKGASAAEKEPLIGPLEETASGEGAEEKSTADELESGKGKDDAKGMEIVPREGEQVVEQSPPGPEDQLRWIFDVDEKVSDSVPISWTTDRDRKKRLADEVYNDLRKHHRDLTKCFQEKVDLLVEDASIRNAEQAIMIEVKNAEEQRTPRGSPSSSDGEISFQNVLRIRMEELQRERLSFAGRADKSDQRRQVESDLEAIRMILSKANSLQIHLQRARLNGRGLPDSSEDEGEFEILGMRDSTRFKNKKVRAAFDSARAELETRMENIEKRVLDLQRAISLGYVNLQEALGFDYRQAIVPILKQHIQHKLVAAVDEDAIRKSDEAQATLLSDLEKEGKKVEPAKVAKAKDAKKKDRRKSKDTKKLASATLSERDVDEGEDSEEELADSPKETKAELRRPEATYDDEDERLLAANLERQRLAEEALAKEKNKSLDAAARRKIEQQEREALLREEEEERQFKHALAESERQEAERRSKQQNGDADAGWELAGSSRRGAHSHQDRGSEEKRSGPRELEQRRPDEGRRPMTTGGMREGPRQRHDSSRIPVVQHPQHHQHAPRNTPPPSPPLTGKADSLAFQQLEDLSKSSSWSHVAGSRGNQPKPQNPRSLKDQQQAALAQRRTAAYYPDSPEVYRGGQANGNGSSPQWHQPQNNDADMTSLSLGGPTGWEAQDARANGGLPGVAEEEPDVSNLMSMLLPSGQKPDNGFAAALRTGLPADARVNGSGQEGERPQDRPDGAIPEDDKRFQADIRLAMQQSLQASGAPSRPQHPPGRAPPSANGTAPAGAETGLQETVAGKGLVNETGQYNCFLNVVIQSLWHLRSFRRRLLDRSSEAHAHVGHPCVVCALREIFTALDNRAPGPGQQGAVDPTPLRMALDAMYSETNFFQEGQMNDASEVLDAVFDAMHKAYTAPPGQEYASSDDEAKPDGWTCTQLRRCIVHDLFGLDVAEEMQCNNCQLASRKLKYTSYFHNINASALRREKGLEPNHTLAELLNCIDHHHDLPCDPDIGGCNKVNRMQYELRATPQVFTTVLGWQTSRESIDDIAATVSAIDVDIDVLTVYSGALSGSRHRLVSVVCYYGQHYHCFAYNQELARWVMFDDTTVKLIGSWDDVMRACCRGHLQPQVLFYERIAD